MYALLHRVYSDVIVQHSDQLPGQVRTLHDAFAVSGSLGCASVDTTGKHSGVKRCQRLGLLSQQAE